MIHRWGSHLLRLTAVVVAAVALVVPAGAVVAGAGTVQTEMVPTPAPWISRTFPTIGSATGGDRVAITGHHFTGITAARFGGVPGSNLVVESDTRIVVTTPAHAVGAVRVRVLAQGRSSVRGVSYEFTDPPTVTGVSPSSGSIDGGTTVTVTGTHLDETCCVRFGGVVATDYDVIDDTTLTVTTPAHVAGDVRVRVIAPDTSSPRSSAARFAFVDAPTLTNIAPTSGSTDGGTTVTLTGTSLTGTSSVTFGGSAAASLTVLNDTTVTVVAPDAPGHAPGAVAVVLTTPAGSTTVTNGFTYVAPPHITSKSPPNGPISGGTSVTIAGTGFTGTTSVLFDGISAAFVVNSDASITAISPAHPGGPGLVSVTVTTPYGTWVDQANMFPFIYEP